jgi:hypothetical protein
MIILPAEPSPYWAYNILIFPHNPYLILTKNRGLSPIIRTKSQLRCSRSSRLASGAKSAILIRSVRAPEMKRAVEALAKLGKHWMTAAYPLPQTKNYRSYQGLCNLSHTALAA